MSDLEKEKETEREVTFVQLFTGDIVHLRSSDSLFVWRHSLYNVSKDLVLHYPPHVLSSRFSSQHVLTNSLRGLSRFPKKKTTQKNKSIKIQTITGMLDSGSKQTLVGFSPQRRLHSGLTCSFLNTRKTTVIHDKAWRAALGKWKYFACKVLRTPDSTTFLSSAP